MTIDTEQIAMLVGAVAALTSGFTAYLVRRQKIVLDTNELFEKAKVELLDRYKTEITELTKELRAAREETEAYRRQVFEMRDEMNEMQTTMRRQSEEIQANLDRMNNLNSL